VTSKIKIGDLITFSKDGEVLHKLYCGDSTLEASWNTLMGEERGELIYTDPPYGISYTGANNPTAKVWDMIENDELRGDGLTQFLTDAFNLAYEYSKKDTAAYCWYANSNYTQFRNGLNAASWEIKQDLIWNKGMTLGRADYHWAHEPCLYLKKNGQRTHWYGNRKHKTILNSTKQDLSKLSKQDLLDIFERIQQDSSVWEIKRDARLFYIHPNQKPIELAGRAMSNSSQSGDIVIDMFSGSGSTLVAAHKLNRKFRGMEMDTKYAQLIINRLERTDPDLEIQIQHTI
jgi:site-specific DNA-methyltransferase (adenine-specific)